MTRATTAHKSKKANEAGELVLEGVRTHNLKNIDVTIPKGMITVVTGPSGSGKSSLAFDTIYAEGQRRYIESLSAYVRQFLERMEKPDLDTIRGITPTVAIEQRRLSRNPTTSDFSSDVRGPSTVLKAMAPYFDIRLNRF